MIPHFTTVTIENVEQPGAIAVGQTVKAILNIEGGGTYSPEQYPGLDMKYQWYSYQATPNITKQLSGAINL